MLPFPEAGGARERASFQCAVISDGVSTYVSFAYAKGGMTFDPSQNRRVAVGWSDQFFGASVYDFSDFDRKIGNGNQEGYWLFLVGEGANPGLKCRTFEAGESLPGVLYANDIIPQCPCNAIDAQTASGWILVTGSDITVLEEAECYDYFNSQQSVGRRCCYRSSEAFEIRQPWAGNFQLYSPLNKGNALKHISQDLNPKLWCCFQSSLCDVYYQLRPVSDCAARQNKRALLFGDPHLSTLDGRTFILHGIGEFRLLEVDITSQAGNGDVRFRLQGRTCKSFSQTGQLLPSTSFCAFALENTQGSSARVEISPNGTFMVMYVNDEDFTLRFYGKKTFSGVKDGFVIERRNDSVRLSTQDDFGIDVALTRNSLTLSVSVIQVYSGRTTGLLGNYNGNSADDFIGPDGTTYSNSMTDKEIFEYTKTWSVDNSNSLFQYGFGQDTSSFTDPSFLPLFLEDVTNITLLQEADSVCGVSGPTTDTCRYEYLVRGDKTIAWEVQQELEDFMRIERAASNKAPTLTGDTVVNATVGSGSRITLEASDPEGAPVTFDILQTPGSGQFVYTVIGSNKILDGFFTPSSTEPVRLVIDVQDDQGLRSAAREIDLRVCNGCSGRGNCAWDDFQRVAGYPYFAVVPCDCEGPYSGDDCSLDKDGCRSRPCPELTTCTDVPALEEMTSGQAYKCSDCPAGYTRFQQGETFKCKDVDECVGVSPSPCPAHADCSNSEGSYLCQCVSGYRETGDGACVDVDECVGVPPSPCHAHADCSNSEGSYLCQCVSGYRETGDGACVDVDECVGVPPSPCHAHADCSNSEGSYLCQCVSGYRETGDGACVDVDECTESSHKCAQLCTNTPGGYQCSCEQGFRVSGPDRRNCSRLQDQDPCKQLGSSKSCSYGCRVTDGQAQCFCGAGFELMADGVSCQDIDECSQRLCSQRCDNSVGGYTCSCLPGYRLSQDDLACQPCPENRYGENCQSECQCRGRQVSCDATRGCVCRPQWTGDGCAVDVDECARVPAPCRKDQLCENTAGDFVCVCPPGYEDVSGTCVDVDECKDTEERRCPQTCVNVPGSFSCVCQQGFEYNHRDNSCDDIDECGSLSSGGEQACVNTYGGFTCECSLGFVLLDDRKTCLREAEVCARYNVKCGYACRLEEQSPVCFCPEGFYLTDGVNCTDTNECLEPAQNECTHSCVNTRGSYLCTCPLGFRLLKDQRTCQECDSFHWGEDCRNQCNCFVPGTARCDAVTGCVCHDGWRGVTCDRDVDECSASVPVCPVSAECRNSYGGYTCVCREGYTAQAGGGGGLSCEDINECDNSPCDHTCVNTVGSYQCTCFSGFRPEGDRCVDIDECGQPSLNNCQQTCRNTAGSLACECLDNFDLDLNDRTSCIQSAGSDCDNTSSCDQGCVVSQGQQLCFCRPGYVLGADNRTCTDI
ncbi:fibrillin-3, partial [Aplysia californica]|uniref:Fibrillin-3 n=1 Tax=Aplysia californica TaxID=6500 RepID=A0ABM1VQZ6_APLCA